MNYSNYVTSKIQGHIGKQTNVTFIYVLQHPVTGDVRYVGKTVYPRRRYSSHISPTKKGNSAVAKWFEKWSALKKYPKMVIIERTVGIEWTVREPFWISHYRKLGCDLLNLNAGGEGSLNPSDESRASVGRASKRAWDSYSPEERKNRQNNMRKNIDYGPKFGKRVSLAKMGKRSKRNQPFSSEYLGVSKIHKNPTWCSWINIGGIRDYLGSYATQEGAASAYNRRSRELFGDKAILNNIRGGEINEAPSTNQKAHFGRVQSNKETSKYPGVYFNTRKNRFIAQFTYNGKKTIVGQFTDEKKAYEAYKEAIAKLPLRKP